MGGRPGSPQQYPVPGPQHRREPGPDRTAGDDERRHEARRQQDASEIIVEGGHVGIVVGRSASQNLWPKVGAWLSAHD